MKEFKEVIASKVDEMIATGKLTEIIEKNLESCIESAVKDCFCYGSDLKKTIEESLQKGLQIDVDQVPLDIYNVQMVAMFNKKLKGLFKEQSEEMMNKHFDSILEPLPKEMDIGEFIEKIVEFWKTTDYDDIDWDCREAKVEFECDDSFSNTSYKLKIKGQSLHDEDLNFFIMTKKGIPSIGTIAIDHSSSFNPTCLDQCETFVFRAYASQMKLTGLDKLDIGYLELALDDYEG